MGLRAYNEVQNGSVNADVRSVPVIESIWRSDTES